MCISVIIAYYFKTLYFDDAALAPSFCRWHVIVLYNIVKISMAYTGTVYCNLVLKNS
jgi:hypothetical protein